MLASMNKGGRYSVQRVRVVPVPQRTLVVRRVSTPSREQEVTPSQAPTRPSTKYGPGYDPNFLGKDFKVALPKISEKALTFGNPAKLKDSSETVLTYMHFSVIMNQQRRLAFVSAVNLDGAKRVMIDRDDGGSDFRIDERMAADLQCANWLYKNNDLDRGHLTRRQDPVWGTTEGAQLANSNSFYYTNIAPQHKDFNQGADLWLGLEDFVLNNTTEEGKRVSVFNGPIFSNKDDLYRGVPIPKAFFKVVAVVDDSGLLRTSAYIVSQEQLVRPSNLRDISRALPVGTFRTFQVPVPEVERLTGLIWDDIIREADVMTRTAGPDTRMAAAADVDVDYTAGWRQLGSLEDVQLGFRDQPAAAAAAGRAAAGPAAAAASSSGGIGKGFDANFLKIKVPLPTVTEAALEFGDVAPLKDGSGTELKYTHYSVVMNKDRRLAFVSAVNIDGANRVTTVGRDDKFVLDQRLDKGYQVGNELYVSNPLDRGHLTRRQDPIWGTVQEAEAGNKDSYYYTNIGPQHEKFNQGKELWLGLEDFVLDNTTASRKRVSVFNGPIFTNQDNMYRGVPIPKEFFKVVVLVDDQGTLRSSAYILSQAELVTPANLGGSRAAAAAPSAKEANLPLGAFRTFQVPVSKVEEKTGLRWVDDVRAADVFKQPASRSAAAAAADRGVGEMMRELKSTEDIVL